MSDTYCPYCGSVINEGDTFCNSCGASTAPKPANAGSPSQTPPPAPPPQQQFTPPAHQYGASTQTVYQQPATTSQDNALGIVSLITSVLGCCVGIFMPFIGIVFFLVGVITGALGMKKTPDKKTMPMIGMIISIIGLVGSIIVTILILVLFAGNFFYLF